MKIKVKKKYIILLVLLLLIACIPFVPPIYKRYTRPMYKSYVDAKEWYGKVDCENLAQVRDFWFIRQARLRGSLVRRSISRLAQRAVAALRYQGIVWQKWWRYIGSLPREDLSWFMQNMN